MANDNDEICIAIIGMSGRFPGARNTDEFWRNLREGRESMTALDDATLLAAGVEPSALADPSYVRVAPVLDGIDLFDAELFDITPAEARLLDPQHRFFLECGWEALEQSGHLRDPRGLSVGVYGSSMMSSYLLSNLMHLPSMTRGRNGLNMETLQVFMANDRQYLATRLAFKLDLQGPCCTVQSACSSSLLAFHMGCQALLARECDLALTGGVSIRIPQHVGYYHEAGSIVSPDGHCRAFDEKGEGTVFGGGVGVVALRRLEDAIADGDHIWAVVRASAANNDGALKMGFAAPSVEAQGRVIEEAISLASVPADSIGYVEAHGTGTNLGDPIEIAALTKAFRASTRRKQFCAIGSVKTNIGHAEGASGIIGLIKAALSLYHQEIPPSLHFEKPNPRLDLENSPFFVNTKLRAWQSRAGLPRRAGVSSLGVGGTNVHVVLEEAPRCERDVSGNTRPWQLLTLSAQSRKSLDAATANVSAFLEAHPELEFADAAYTLNVGRAALRHRRFAVCRDAQDATQVLAGREPSRVSTGAQSRSTPPVVFMFPGQGSQYPNMGLELLETEPTFRASIDECAEILKPELNLDIRTIIYPAASQLPSADAELMQTAITQPALFTVEYALARTWLDRGITPSALVGHSVGEFVVACLADIISLDDALRLVALRGRLIQRLPRGSMLSVALSPERLTPYLTDGVALAAINEPNRCVISGRTEAIDDCARRLADTAVAYRPLHTSHAFHSEMVDPILDAFSEATAKIRKKPPKLRCLSNVTGTWLADEEAQDPNYWTRQMRCPVRFEEDLTCVLSEGPAVLLEVGPGRTLTRFAKAHALRKEEHAVVSSMRHPSENVSDVQTFLQALGQLWMHGARINWSRHWQNEQRRREPLPTYSFDHKRYWIEAPARSRNSSSSPRSSADPVEVPETECKATSAEPSETDASRPGVGTPYAQPRTATEALLAGLWSDLLGIANVGIHDNFLELGGDSVLAVQVAAKANALGVRMGPKHLFEHQTIAELAAAIDSRTAPKPAARKEDSQADVASPSHAVGRAFSAFGLDAQHVLDAILTELKRN